MRLSLPEEITVLTLDDETVWPVGRKGLAALNRLLVRTIGDLYAARLRAE
jgi:nucleotidyltransferase/DNA polymerase involved in DNA repair